MDGAQKLMNDAEYIKEMMHRCPDAWKVLMGHYKAYQEEALRRLMDVTLPDETLKYRQLLCNEISRWVGFPEFIIKMAENAALEAQKYAKQQSFNKEVRV